MRPLVINPGAGPVVGATTLDHARANMAKLLEDLGVAGVAFRRAPDREENGGRFPFVVSFPGRDDVLVKMPGLPLEAVRYIGNYERSIWDFPRLYVDGSSWHWCVALEILHEKARGET